MKFAKFWNIDWFTQPYWQVGSDGNDLLVGSRHDDRISGGDGDGGLLGRAGNDRLSGGEGNDIVFGGRGLDLVEGGAGHDRLFGGRDADRLEGGTGNDRLSGGRGNDLLDGGTGHDKLFGGSGHDILLGGLGNDTIKGGSGFDTVKYTDEDVGVTVRLDKGRATRETGFSISVDDAAIAEADALRSLRMRWTGCFITTSTQAILPQVNCAVRSIPSSTIRRMRAGCGSCANRLVSAAHSTLRQSSACNKSSFEL